MKYLIAGLGNIGEEYIHTRHNIGFDIADALAHSAKASFVLERHALMASYKFRGKNIFVIKPTTFMNLGGKAVNYWLQKENIPKENLLAIADDIALSFGTIRIRTKGGDGGHNGLTSIIESIGSSSFARLRFGIGSNYPKGAQADYVLSTWNEEEKKILPERIVICMDAVKSFIAHGISQTMNNFNNK